MFFRKRSFRLGASFAVIAAVLALFAAQTCLAQTEAAERPHAKGVLTGDNVNVRHGAGTEFPIYYKASMGAEVKVVARKGQWLEIEFPAKAFSWVAVEYLTKIDDDTGIITDSQVNVRSGPGLQFDTLYRVQTNHKFQIMDTSADGDWHRVAPMPGATAWLISDYVRLSGPLPGEAPTTTTPVPTTTRPTTSPTTTAPTTPEPPKPPPGTYERKLQEADDKLQAEIAKEDPSEWDLDTIAPVYTDVKTNAENPVLRVKARTRLAQLKAYGAVKTRAIEIGRIDEGLAAQLKELEKARQEETSAAARVARPYLITGMVGKFHIPGLAGATHKVMDGEAIAYLLRSKVTDLSLYEGKNCGIKGDVVAVPGLKVQIIDVTNATVLSGS